MQNKKGQNTHSKAERVKVPLLPYNVDKKNVNDSRPTVGSQQKPPNGAQNEGFLYYGNWLRDLDFASVYVCMCSACLCVGVS